MIHICCWGILSGQAHEHKCGLDHSAVSPWRHTFPHTLPTADLRGDTLCIIPVVVHIVWHRDHPEENIPDWQVASQIDILNETFRKRNENLARVPSEFRDDAADVGFEFCLVATNRFVTRYDSIGNIFSVRDNMGEKRLFRTDLGGADAWAVEEYLNIWVANTGSEFLGFGTLPDPDFRSRNQLRPYEDGIVINPRHFGYTCYEPYHLGRVVTHEVGHYFNLPHIWGNRRGCDVDDGIADTPPQLDRYDACPDYPAISCASSDMFMNYMDNTWDECQMFFTNGQKARMRETLVLYRTELANSNKCEVIPPSDENSLQLLPNPAHDAVEIVFDYPQRADIVLEVFDTAGRRIYAASGCTGNVASLPTLYWAEGIYLVSIFVDDQVFTEKLMVRHE
ncbi:MAG: M43 family zinc metalloprotease [Bacteroidota bacterium]